MSQPVKFFCKRSKSKNPDGTFKLHIHSICRTTSSWKYKFDGKDREIDQHIQGVQDSIAKFIVKSKRHVDYTLKGDELHFYMNPATSQFWFNGKALKKVSASQVSSRPSEDNADESTSSTGETTRSSSNENRSASLSVQRQNAMDEGKIRFDILSKTRF